MDRAAVEKLKLPELKAKCKELKLTGYSKLNKPALIDKLLACPALSSLSVAAAAAASLGAPSVAAHHAPPAPGQTPSGPSAAHSTAQGWNDLISWPDEAAEPSANALIGGEVDLVGLSAGRPSAAHTPVPRPSVAPHARGQTPSSTAALPSADLPPPSASSASAGAPGKKKQKKTKAAKAAHTASAPGPPRPPHAPPSAVPPASSVASREASSSPNKRPAVAQPTVEPPAKKQTVGSKTVVGSSSAAARKTFKPLAIAPQPVPPTVLPPAASPPGSSTPVLSTPAASTVAPRPPKAKSTFRAPVPKASTAAPKPPTKISRPAETSPALLQSDSLSFAPVQDDAAAVNPITLPPPLRARAKVHTLALLVSALERPERDAVALSGKAGRYAVFLSAYHRLQRRFPGARLLTFLSHSSVDSSTSNLWPYLRAREHEVSVRRAAVQSSWLAHLWSAHQLGTPGADPAFDAVADRLYGSPDDPIQLAVALRVVLARLHTALAVVPDARELQHGGLGRVVGARKVAEGVWRIDWVRKVTSGEAAGGDVKESLLVLEETGEPLGRTGDPSAASDAPPSSPTDAALIAALRPDWRALVTSLLPSSAAQPVHAPPASFLALVQTPYSDEFPAGVHAFWARAQRAAMSATATETGRVAGRYVLASCVLQSTSGTYRTAGQMSADFDGTAAAFGLHPAALPSGVDLPSVNLFLPARHHVLSVDLSHAGPSSSSSPAAALHPALAAVHLDDAGASADAEFVLRETGQVVGGGPDGVCEVWQRLVGCDARGLAV